MSIIKNVKNELAVPVNENKRHCWANILHLRWECLEVVGIPSSTNDTALVGNLCYVFKDTDDEFGDRQIRVFYRLKNKIDRR